MIVKSVHIEQFRAFNDVSFELGRRVTAIAGRNATQKTTVLGMIGQPFSITQPSHPMLGCKTIDGYDFKSQFGEKFKFSDAEQPGDHKWTLHLNDNIHSQNGECKPYFTAETINRNRGKLRIWNAEDRAHSAGKGYVQIPVYYLSLSRLYPIGETVGKTKPIDSPTQDETTYCLHHYREIMQIMDIDSDTSIGIEEKTVKQKFTGISNGTQDVSTNSAGEGNITRIMLAMLSFKRLKDKYGLNYKGGILLIDELDAAVYPYAQRKLVEYLYNAANEFDVQVVFTTHSATILEALITLQNKRQKGRRINTGASAYDSTIVYLKPDYNADGKSIIASNICNLHGLRELVADMNLEYLKPAAQVQAYCEDEMAVSLTDFLIKKYYGEYANFVSVQGLNLGWTEIVRLLEINAFSVYDSLILLDFDVPSKHKSAEQRKTLESSENVVYMPLLVEEGLFELLRNPESFDQFDREFSTNRTFTRDVCYAEYPLETSYYKSQSKATEIFKAWFNRAVDALGDKTVLFDFWYTKNESRADSFIRDFCLVYNKLADRLKIDPLPLPAKLAEFDGEI